MAEGEGSGTRNPLVVAAEAIDRSRAIARGYLKKKSSGKSAWQRRFFFVLPGAGATYFLAYSKSEDGAILASMDLAQAGAVEAVEDGSGCQFAIPWDIRRVFCAASADECRMWVSTIKRVQAEASRRGAKDWGAGKRSSSGAAGAACCEVQ